MTMEPRIARLWRDMRRLAAEHRGKEASVKAIFPPLVLDGQEVQISVTITITPVGVGTWIGREAVTVDGDGAASLDEALAGFEAAPARGRG